MANSPVLVPARRVHSPPATFRQAAPATALPFAALPAGAPCAAISGNNFCGKCGEPPRNLPSRVLRPMNGDVPQQVGPWMMEPVTARLSAPSQPSSFTAMPGPPRHILGSQLRTNSPRQIRGLSKPEDEYRDRRPTDPFFYPTTVNPLTGLGLNLIEESTPPKPQIVDMAPRVVEDLRPSKLKNFSDLEDMSLLQRQNDELAKHMQDLERAKSLAAMTSAQALQKIRQRQEQLRKEQQQCMVKAKEIQAEYSPGPEVEGPVVQLPEGAHERRTPAKVEPEDIGQTQLAQPPQQTGGISSTSSTLRREVPAQQPPAAPAQPAQQLQRSAIRPCLSGRSSESREASPPPSKRMAEVTSVPPAAGVLDYTGDITAIAATLLRQHETPGYREAKMDVVTPYVDALGNPLPPIRKLDDLPNIKDTPEAAATAEVEGPMAATSALIQVDSGVLGPLTSAEDSDSPRNKAVSGRLEKPAVVVAHEKAPTNSPRDRQGSSRISRGDKGAETGESSKGSKTRPKATPSTQLPPEVAEELQAELDECLDTIKWCASSITRDSLQDVKNTNRPAPVVKDVLEAVSILLAQTETRWEKLKQMISKPQFFDKLQRLDFQRSVSKEQFKKLREKLAHPHFDEELIKTVSVPMVPLAMWCRAIGVHLSKTKYRGGPEIRPVAGAGATPQLQYDERRENVEIRIEPDLSMLDADEIRHVENLTISREGVGTITFEGETDCSDLDFQNIVRLEVGEVLVYPHPKTKPEVGVGLNKAAIVTMYQCWPPNGSMLAQDLEQQEEYKRRIKVMTEEKKARFIDYDCMTGVWKFGVDHF